MRIMTKQEFIYRELLKKSDIYDNIDALLDLKHKYSKFELEQLRKEKKARKDFIVVENAEMYAKLANKNI